MGVISLLTVSGNYIAETINQLTSGNEVDFWVNTCHNKKLRTVTQGDYAAVFLKGIGLMYVGEVIPATTISNTACAARPIVTTSIQNTFDAYNRIHRLGSLGLNSNENINDFINLINLVFSSKNNLNAGDKITSIIIRPVSWLTIGTYNTMRRTGTPIVNSSNNNAAITLPNGKILNIPEPGRGSKSIIVV